MATPRSTRNRPSLATPKFNVADVAKQATRRKPAPGYSFSETRQMAPGYGNPVTPTQRPNTDIVPKEPLPQLVEGKDGKMVPFDPNAEAPVRSYEDIGASLAQDEYTQNLATELDITGEQKGYTSLEEYAADQYDALKESKQLQEAKLADQQLQTSEGVTQAEKSLRSQTLSGASRLAGNREGFVSSSNQSVASKLGRLASEKMQRINSQKDLVDMEIKDARANLDRAERAGSTQIAEQYRQVLDAAEYKARQIDTEYYNALSQQAQEKRANFTVFQGLVDSGQELDTETIAGFAEQLGIPFNDAYGYYKGQQAVRDNNKLTNDEKAIELQNLAYDFDRKLRGIETEQQIAIDFLKTMREKGFSEEEISAYKQMNGITDYDDPITQAELRIKQAEARIQEIEAGGEPPYNSKAYWERESLKAQVRADRAEYNTLYGNPATAIDQAQAESIFTDLGQSRWFSEPGKLQCGEGYNRITEGSGRAGSTYVEKMGLVTKRDNPMVGNGLVIPIGDADVGHIETILSVDEENRTIQTISWNRDLNGSMTIQSYNLDELQSGAKYGNNWGFTDSQLKPEFQKKLLAAGGSLGGQKTYSDGQRAIMDVMDINSLTSTDLKILKENGLTSEDLFGYVTNSKQTLDEDAKAKVQNVYDAIVALKSSPGLSGAVGAGWGTLPFLEGPPSGTPAADFIAKFNLLKDTLAMENLNQLKGALSDKDLEFLRNTATSLNLSNSEATFKQTLQALEDKYASLLSQGTDISSVDSLDSDLNLYQYGTEDPQSTLWDNLP